MSNKIEIMEVGWKLFIILLIVIFGTMFLGAFANLEWNQVSFFLLLSIFILIGLIGFFEGYKKFKKK